MKSFNIYFQNWCHYSYSIYISYIDMNMKYIRCKMCDWVMNAFTLQIVVYISQFRVCAFYVGVNCIWTCSWERNNLNTLYACILIKVFKLIQRFNHDLKYAKSCQKSVSFPRLTRFKLEIIIPSGYVSIFCFTHAEDKICYSTVATEKVFN